jgi:hypothetical protein
MQQGANPTSERRRRAWSTIAMSMTRLLTAPATRPTTLAAVVDDPTSMSTCRVRAYLKQ